MPMLIRSLELSSGDVVEVGGGLFSTPILHWYCKLHKRKLITYENEPTFFEFAKKFQSPGHRVRLIKNWDDMDFKTHRGLVFIDHHPNERRTVDIINFKNSADYIVIHDTEKPEKYGYDAIWEHFKYTLTWKDCRPWTSVVSNFKELNNLSKLI